ALRRAAVAGDDQVVVLRRRVEGRPDDGAGPRGDLGRLGLGGDRGGGGAGGRGEDGRGERGEREDGGRGRPPGAATGFFGGGERGEHGDMVPPCGRVRGPPGCRIATPCGS